MDYDIFSRYYDTLTADVDYEKRTAHLLELFSRYGKKPSLLLDVGCGTGGFSLEFAKQNIEVIGADPSPNMLEIARRKAENENLDILFLNQSGEELDLYGTVDGAISCLDTVNHIINKNALQKFFDRVSLFLEPECLFIFDINTLYKQEYILGNNTFVFDAENVYCVWQNWFDKRNKITDITLDFFEKQGASYIKSQEQFSERVYSFEELSLMFKKSGLKVIKILGENSLNKPSKTAQRHIYVTRKEI